MAQYFNTSYICVVHITQKEYAIHLLVSRSQHDQLQGNRVSAQQKHMRLRRQAQMLGASRNPQIFDHASFVAEAGRQESSPDGYPSARCYLYQLKQADQRKHDPLQATHPASQPQHGVYVSRFQVLPSVLLSSFFSSYLVLLFLQIVASPFQFQVKGGSLEQIFQSWNHAQQRWS